MPAQLRRLPRLLIYRLVRRLNRRIQPSFTASLCFLAAFASSSSSRSEARQKRIRRKIARNLARRRSAHPIAHHKGPNLRSRRASILVSLPDTAPVGKHRVDKMVRRHSQSVERSEENNTR